LEFERQATWVKRKNQNGQKTKELKDKDRKKKMRPVGSRYRQVKKRSIGKGKKSANSKPQRNVKKHLKKQDRTIWQP